MPSSRPSSRNSSRLQVPARDRVHRRAAEDGDRQDPALPPARARARRRRMSAPGRSSAHPACAARRASVGALPPGRELARLPWRGRELHLEYEWVGAPRSAHRRSSSSCTRASARSRCGRTSRASFCDAHGLAGFVFSRYGYGRSTPKPARRALAGPTSCTAGDEVLPALFAAVGIDRPWLFGHSDGGIDRACCMPRVIRWPAWSRSRRTCSSRTSRSTSIEHAARRLRASDLRARLARHHADPDSAFRGWNDVWLAPEFRDWNIEARDRDDRLPGARGAGRGRRVRHAGADPRRSRADCRKPACS